MTTKTTVLIPRDVNIEKSWQEDFSHENGNYTNCCIECKKLFLGHKRRVICKSCYNKIKIK